MTGSWGSWPDDDHRRVPHEHVHLDAVDGWHAHVHRHDGLDEHSHVHVHAGEAGGTWEQVREHVREGEREVAAGAPMTTLDDLEDTATRRHRPLLPDDHHDDEVGVLVTEGILPEEARGRHCRYCGEDIEPRVEYLPFKPGEYVLEYQHAATRTVHCAMSWQGGLLVGLAEETASPCWRPNCLSDSEYEAKEAGEQGNG